MGSGAAGSSIADSGAAGSSDGATLAPATPQSSRGQPAAPYQQAVQPLSKSTGLGVTFNSSANKPSATGGQDADGHGRQSTRGQDDNSWPASCSRGTRERSSIRTTSKQMPCQVGERSSGAPRNVPPASTPESTPPQSGGGARASPKDPLKNAANYRSARWRKDLEHVLKAYYRDTVASFKEVEWAKMKEKFFTHLLQHKEGWRNIKENHPLQYMPYMEEHFYAATGLRLNGLSNFTGWIKRGSYYHRLVARQGQLHKCPHLVGVVLPRWPQVTPSESCRVSQKKAETPATSSSVPNTEASKAQETHSNDVPAPMETGGAGDSWSWVDQVEASADDEFRRDRPTKHRWSQSRRQEDQPTLPFPLQDNEGRCSSAQQLYQHAGEQPWAHHNVAALGITHLHPEVEPREARNLSNQVLCMIAEYHLTGSAQGTSSLSPVLPEVARDLLPPIEDYVMGGMFQGTRDVRVVERAKTLRIATWLHRLDMAAEGDETASQTLEVTRHGRGPLLDLLLAPRTSSLMFAEVVECVLAENWHRVESSLDDLQGHRAQLRGELDNLTEARREESDKSSRKRIKKEIDLRWKDLESLRVAISHHESSLGRGQPQDITTSDDDSSDHGAGDAAKAEMAIAPVANDTPSGSATTQSSDPPPAKGQTHAMEVDDKDGGPPPASPISPGEDDLLTGGGAVGVEGEMTNLKVSSPKGPDGGGKDTSI